MLKPVLRVIGVTLFVLIVALCLAIVLAPPFLDRIYYRGPVSGHYDGARFFNPDGDDMARPPGGRSRGGFLLRWITGNDDRPAWPQTVPVTQTRPAARVEGEQMVATWIGHATVLVQTQGLNILTDPIWSERAGPFGLVGPKRVTAPGVRFQDLPKIDVVIVSHNHYDHLDLDTLKRLWERDKPLIVTSLGNDAVIAGAGARAVAADWGQRVSVRPGIDVVVTRNHHWGSRWFTDRNRALWSSFTITLPGGNIFFAGDTGAGDMQWPAEAARIGPVRLAIIPIGAFRFFPGSMETGSHIGPVDAVEVFRRLDAQTAIPIHWGTFRLSFEAYDTPPRLLKAALDCSLITHNRPGRTFDAAVIGRPIAIAPLAAIRRPPEPVAMPERDRAEVLRCLDTPAVRAME